MNQNNAKKRLLPVILFTIFIDMIGFGIIIPIMPQLFANPASPLYLLPRDFSLKTAYIILGFIIASYPIAQFIFAPILGQLSDKFGRKIILAVSIGGACLGYLFFGFGIAGKNLIMLFVSRLVAGATGGNISIAQASIADVTSPADRAKNFGLMGAAFGLGFILGPYIGGKLSDPGLVSWFDATTPFFFASLLSFLNLISVALFFKDTNQTMLHIKINFWSSIKNIVKAFTHGDLKMIFMTVFIFNAGFTFFTTFFNVFLTNRFHFNQGNIGDFFAFVGLCVALAQAFVTRAVAKKFKEHQILRVSIIINGIIILLFLFAGSPWQLFLIVPVFAIFNGLSQANSAALVSASAPQSIQGEVLGLNTSVTALAQSIPPILSGFIAASLTPESPIIVAAIVVAAAGIFFNVFYKHPPASLNH